MTRDSTKDPSCLSVRGDDFKKPPITWPIMANDMGEQKGNLEAGRETLHIHVQNPIHVMGDIRLGG